MTNLIPLLPYLRWGATAPFVVAVIVALLAVRQFIRSRRAPYYILRENARRRAGRYTLVALILLIFGVVLSLAPAWGPRLLPRPTPTPTFTPSPTATPTVTPTPLPTPTPTRRPTATPPFIPTPTPAVPLPDTALTPIPGAVPARPEAAIVVAGFAADVDAAGNPVGPGTEFPPGDHPVYVFISFRGMMNGVAWTFAWYRDEEYLDGETRLWEWGEEDRTYLYYKPPGGYEPGTYEVRVFIENRLQGIAQFVITEE